MTVEGRFLFFSSLERAGSGVPGSQRFYDMDNPSVNHWSLKGDAQIGYYNIGQLLNIESRARRNI
jgi:hypothetical protein